MLVLFPKMQIFFYFFSKKKSENFVITFAQCCASKNQNIDIINE